jgi:hypothetical protein
MVTHSSRHDWKQNKAPLTTKDSTALCEPPVDQLPQALSGCARALLADPCLEHGWQVRGWALPVCLFGVCGDGGGGRGRSVFVRGCVAIRCVKGGVLVLSSLIPALNTGGRCAVGPSLCVCLVCVCWGWGDAGCVWGGVWGWKWCLSVGVFIQVCALGVWGCMCSPR